MIAPNIRKNFWHLISIFVSVKSPEMKKVRGFHALTVVLSLSALMATVAMLSMRLFFLA